MKRKPAWERILLPLLFLWAIPTHRANEVTPESLEELKTAVEAAQQNDATIMKVVADMHNKQNKTLFTHEQILKGRLPKPR